MPVSVDRQSAVQDEHQRLQQVSHVMLSCLPPGVEPDHIPVIIALAMGHTHGHTGLLTGYSIQRIDQLAIQYRPTINNLVTQRDNLLAEFGRLAVYDILMVGLEATAMLMPDARAGKLDAHAVAALARAGQCFAHLHDYLTQDNKAHGSPVAPVLREVKDALAMLPK